LGGFFIFGCKKVIKTQPGPWSQESAWIRIYRNQIRNTEKKALHRSQTFTKTVFVLKTFIAKVSEIWLKKSGLEARILIEVLSIRIPTTAA
jgi:hypothetical protein